MQWIRFWNGPIEHVAPSFVAKLCLSTLRRISHDCFCASGRERPKIDRTTKFDNALSCGTKPECSTINIFRVMIYLFVLCFELVCFSCFFSPFSSIDLLPKSIKILIFFFLWFYSVTSLLLPKWSNDLQYGPWLPASLVFFYVFDILDVFALSFNIFQYFATFSNLLYFKLLCNIFSNIYWFL